MRNLCLTLSILLSLFITFTPVKAKDIQNVGPTYGRADEEMGQEEGLVKLNWPLKYLRYDLKELLLSADSSITELSKIDLNPIKRTLHLDGKLKLPDSLLLTMEEKAGDKLMNEHSFSFVIEFPQYIPGRYVQFQIKRFQLDGIDYTNGFHIISRIVPALLVNRSLINYFMDDTKAPTDYSDSDLSQKIKHIVDSKIIEFKNDIVRVNFNLSHFTSFKRYSDFEELRLWYFAPRKIAGTQQGVELVIEGGIGAPSKNFITQAKIRHLKDKKSLDNLRSKDYLKYQYSDEVKYSLNSLVDKMIEETGFSNWNAREEFEIKDLKSTLNSRARKLLHKDDNYFSDEPKLAHEEFQRISKDYATNYIADLKIRHALDIQNRQGGRKSVDLPFATKRLSQKAINQFTNYFRDFELKDGEPLFSKINIALAPQLPGVVIKGDVNLEINSLFELGLEGEGIDFGGPNIRADDKTYGSSIPFELSLYTYMRDNGVLELDIKTARIGEHGNSIILNPHNDKGDFLEVFTKMTIVHILKTYLISDPMATADPKDRPTPELARKELFKKIFTYKRKFQNISDSSNDVMEVLKIREYDLNNNPFLELPAQLAQQETVDFFRNILGYDKSSGRVQVFLDPTIFSEKILYADNKIQLWNFEPIFDKKNDKTYLEVAVGNDTRSSKYLDYIYEREEKLNGETFSGTSGFKENEGPVDYAVRVDLKEFQNTVNSILTASLFPHTEKIKSELKKVEEGSFSVLEDITLLAADQDSLAVTIKLNSIEKKKKSIVSRAWNRVFDRSAKSFEITNNRASATARLLLKSVPLSEYKDALLKKSPNEIFLGNTLIKVDLETIGYKTINPGIFGKIANSLIGKVNMKDGLIGSNLKKIILKFAGPSLNEDGNKNGNTVIGGFHLNNYVKIYTHKGEILLQINPRFAGPVWDFYMLANKEHKGEKIGLRVEKDKNLLGMDFVSAYTPSTVDKIELYNITKEAISLSKKIQNSKSLKTPELLSLYDKLFYNNDRMKKSLYHKFLDIVNSYEELSLLGNNENQVNLTRENFNFTSAGAELMHIAIAANLLKDALKESLKLSSRNGIVNYTQQIEDTIRKLENSYIQPMLGIYKERFLVNNMRIINKKVTDWNYLVYPDAIFAQKSYRYISNKK